MTGNSRTSKTPSKAFGQLKDLSFNERRDQEIFLYRLTRFARVIALNLPPALSPLITPPVMKQSWWKALALLGKCSVRGGVASTLLDTTHRSKEYSEIQ